MATVPLKGSNIIIGSPPRGKGVPDTLPLSSQCIYTPYYCEENVWHLCDYIRKNSPTELQNTSVVFISNEKRAVPLWRQKAGKTEDKLVIWDYHCILFYHPDVRCLVYDLDSELPFPTFFHKYVTETFRTDDVLKPDYHRQFRIIPASDFLQNFASDRSHMKNDDGVWIREPPLYPCIMTSNNSNNFEEYISMKPNTGMGEVLGFTQLVKQFLSK